MLYVYNEHVFITGAIQKSTGALNIIIEKEIGVWFRSSGDRCGGRKRREEKRAMASRNNIDEEDET